MSETKPPLESSRLRSRGGCLFLGLPLVLVPAIILAYAGVWGLGLRGRPAEGDTVRVSYAGCPEAGAPVLARVEQMGLGDPRIEEQEGGFALIARMPADERVAAQIPITLTERGKFELYWGAERAERVAGPEDVVEVFPRMTGDASATSVVKLDPELAGPLQRRQLEDPQAHLEVFVDDVHVDTLNNTSPLTENEVDIEPMAEGARDAIEEAAARAVVLANPLPCDIEHTGTETVP
ncbi:MAG: hypothetical protein EP330_28650 [Deltaproteobacteria bacterium]|nr:MAG: hypothetical protein EP330_28650 [Deltaproteobacteria bacterium]